ncbi:NAD(P)/FAD-dependent oxidoreductase [Thiocapsa roseopersicina]|uniref:Sulfide dehydrogenase (Flavocytochrome c), flavoprotein subunit n=1 Tax=Thiocapsa roseopersicina TaxID=1058 RepID=A0A1H2RNE0_THIRO|nr:NAD(P)/FAD-dependent oxidoreductase [Thiocapsa roseopersicina]SDW20976.1 sulfide dehydrogenase (flavocytochrome c), flavoprotein subunit [Thiocapsa roseopersicina]
MNTLTRRNFLQSSLLSTAAVLGGPSLAVHAATPPKARVVVIGGGYGGTIAAKYLQMSDPEIRVTLIEKDSAYVSCPLSNEVLGGERDLASLTFDYRGLTRRGIAVMQDTVVEIDPVQHFVTGASGNRYNYDKLIVSPGVDYDWAAIEGMSEAVAEKIPHAWKAGKQTQILRRQLEAMEDGGVFYIVAPPNPFRCPPGPYERAAQVAHYFSTHKPKSKIVILDAKDAFSKQALFQAGWEEHYGDMIEWVSGAQGGIIEAIDPETRTLMGSFEEFKGDVINLIPHQKAGALAQTAGLANESGWCPVDQRTFESSIHKDIHVIGDACIAGAMPKSGYSANSQGKVCAAAIVAAINGEAAPAPSYVNTCYSIIAPEHGISVAGVYRLEDGRIVDIPGAGGVSPADADARTRALEQQFALDWFRNITSDMFT